MVVKTIDVIVEISQRLTVVEHHSLAAVDLGRTVVAHHIQDQLDASGMHGVHEPTQGPGAVHTGVIAGIDEMGIESFEVTGPVAMHRGELVKLVVHLLEQGRQPEGGDTEGAEVIRLGDQALQISPPVVAPVLMGGIEQTGPADLVVVDRSAEKAVHNDEIDGLLAEVRLLDHKLLAAVPLNERGHGAGAVTSRALGADG